MQILASDNTPITTQAQTLTPKKATTPKEKGTPKKKSKSLTMVQILAEIKKANLSVDELAEIAREANKFKKLHSDYKAPTKAKHVKAKNTDLNKILNAVYGWNAALRETKKLIANGTIKPKTWIPKDKTYNVTQANFAIRNTKTIKPFLRNDMERSGKSLTPKMVINAIVKASTMDSTLFAKAQAIAKKK